MIQTAQERMLWLNQKLVDDYMRRQNLNIKYKSALYSLIPYKRILVIDDCSSNREKIPSSYEDKIISRYQEIVRTIKENALLVRGLDEKSSLDVYFLNKIHPKGPEYPFLNIQKPQDIDLLTEVELEGEMPLLSTVRKIFSLVQIHLENKPVLFDLYLGAAPTDGEFLSLVEEIFSEEKAQENLVMCVNLATRDEAVISHYKAAINAQSEKYSVDVVAPFFVENQKTQESSTPYTFSDWVVQRIGAKATLDAKMRNWTLL